MRKYQKPKSEYQLRIGQHIRLWRGLKGVKQHELASKIGITTAALSQIENDATEITLQRLEDIADALCLKPADLFAGPNHLSTVGDGTMNKDLLNRIVILMENMNNYFSGKPIR